MRGNSLTFYSVVTLAWGWHAAGNFPLMGPPKKSGYMIHYLCVAVQVIWNGTGSNLSAILVRVGLLMATCRQVEWPPRVLYDAARNKLNGILITFLRSIALAMMLAYARASHGPCMARRWAPQGTLTDKPLVSFLDGGACTEAGQTHSSQWLH